MMTVTGQRTLQRHHIVDSVTCLKDYLSTVGSNDSTRRGSPGHSTILWAAAVLASRSVNDVVDVRLRQHYAYSRITKKKTHATLSIRLRS